MGASRRAAERAVTAFLHDAGTAFREVAFGEWGLVVDDIAGAPLEIGLRLADGLLRAQAWGAAASLLDPHLLLHRNRLGVLARYAHASSGDVHVHAELAERAVCAG